ncbi:hypothetical protein HAD_08945 [Hyphomonas adhaerens MHS-3]|uniref:Uncharacterized protein n=1 Tax=Hyphomonas adhaerens MHS-3 TaxID=1280949 RepID=A0A069E697_9PROT|nr:hypothetical protein [Hyphomonas adhaerens]KCZ85800.1 hypothetical protein HAD_08945 [Hyphomonas adhaerens MHS-3]
MRGWPVPGKRDRILSGWRARRLLRTGGLIVRDGAAFRLHQWADERSRRCGRLPAHVVVRLKAADLLAAFRGDPDRLVQAGDVPLETPRPVAVLHSPNGTPPVRVLEHIAASSPLGVRLRAAAGRFRADYHLAASPGRLRTDAPKQLAAACERLTSIETALGPDTAGLIEMLVLDRFTVSALRHETGGGLDRARDALARLTEAYGLLCPDQEAGRAFASS